MDEADGALAVDGVVECDEERLIAEIRAGAVRDDAGKTDPPPCLGDVLDRDA